MGAAIPGVTGLLHQPTGQVIDGSLRFDSGEKNYLTRISGAAGSGTTFTFSTWTRGTGDGTFFCNGEASTGDNGLYIMITSGSLYVGTWTTSWQWYIDTNRLFRDDGWYHIVVSVDTTISSPESDRVKLYVNGVQETSLDSGSSYPSQNYDTLINNTAAHAIGRQGELDSHYIDKRLSQVYWIDGQQLGPEYFGFTDPLTNTWKPKKFTGNFTLPASGVVYSDNGSGTVNGSRTYDKAFDGSTSTFCEPSDNQTVTFDFTSLPGGGITVGSSLRMYLNKAGTPAAGHFTVNGTNLGGSVPSGDWLTINSVSLLQTITFYHQSGSSSVELYAVEVDGSTLTDGTAAKGANSFYLPMDGNSPIGQDKSGIVTPNNGSIWSESLASSSGFRGSEPKTNAFDGNTSSICSAVGSGTITFTSPVTFASNSTIRVFLHGGDHTVTVNGGSDQTISAGSFQTVTYSNSGNATFTMTFHRGGGADTGVRAIEINGVILIDGQIGNNWTPVKFGNTNKIDSPDLTGGTPILNTNEAGTVALPGYRSDPNASNLVVALPLVGATGGTVFDDIAYLIKGSGSSKSFTAFTGNSDGGGTTSTRGSVLYGSSFYTTRGATNANAGDYIERTGDSDLSMGTGDYTIEFWFHPYQMDTNDVLIDTRHPTTDWPTDDNGIMIYINANGDVAMVSNGVQISGSGVVGKNQDNHFALTREGTTERLFVNGNLIGTATNRTNDYDRDRLHLGSSAPNGEGSSGYYNDLRVYKGVAKYTSPFKVGSPNPTVVPDTPSGVSGGSKLTKITEGAVNFDGSGDYLDAGAVDVAFGSSSDFTIECFVSPRAIGLSAITDPRTSDSSYHPLIWMGGSPGNKPEGVLYYYTGGADRIVGTTVLSVNKWYHVAVVRSNGTTTMYLDGEIEGSFSDSFDYASTTNFRMGTRYNNTNFPFNGFISNMRVVNGTALYTSSFTPPTEPLTNVTNTKLLCCQSPTSATTSLVAPANEPFSGAGGAQGRGTTSDYLQVSSSGHSDFSLDGDFTVEWWHYRADISSNNGFMWTIGDSKTSTGLELYWGTSGTQLNLYTNDGSNITSATAATGWHHYAVVRNGTGSANITVYYDGTSVHTISNNTTFSGNVTIGGEFYNGTIYGGMHGPMSQFRFVKGTAVYTSNFTAPTTALTAITNTKILTLQGDTITDASGTNKVIKVFGNVNTDDIAARGDVSTTPFNPFNTDINTVRGQESGYATLNPLKVSNTSSIVLSNGNLRVDITGNYYNAVSTLGMSSGKFYCEISPVRGYSYFGIATGDVVPNTWGGDQTNNSAWVLHTNGSIHHNNATTNGTGFPAPGTSGGYVLGLLFDADNKTMRYVYKGAISKIYNMPNTVDGDSYYFFVGGDAGSYEIDVNFGQKPFKFPPPDGFQPLNAANVLPETVIARPDQFVGVTTYMSNNDILSKNDYKFQPDLLIFKNLDTANHWGWFDSVRGANKQLSSNRPNAEITTSGVGYGSGTMNSFDPFGFTIGDDVGSNTTNYPTNNEHVVYGFKAGGNKNTFNVNDVGYASASDVGMNVGGQNSNYYDSSQTWSNFLSSPQGAYNNSPTTNAFNGDLSSKFESGNPVNSHSTIRFEPSTPIRVNKGIRIYAFDYSDGQVSYQYRVNDASSFTTITYSSGGSPYHRWVDLNFVGDLSSFEYRSNTSITYKPSLLAVEIDGRQLLDSGVTPTDNYPTIPATSCSVGTKQGFGITKYTGNDQVGASIPHGLLETPKFVVIKNMTNSYGWATLHTDVGFTGSYINGSPEYYMLQLDSSAARDDWSQDTIWDPTPSYVRIDASGGANWINNSNSSYIMYAWHDVPGLQKFGKFTGNSSDDGVFVELGFKPAVLLIKNDNSTGDWIIWDNERNKFNPVDRQVWPYTNSGTHGAYDQVASSYPLDFLSNGFKMRTTDADMNDSGRTYIYAAWAEVPTVNLYGGQANAR